MPSQGISAYYQATENRQVRSDLEFAITLVGDLKVAIDCGCGAGADIAYLTANHFQVYGFDIENESIAICQKRFENDHNVIVSKDDFCSFNYPEASLVVADASLFFCAKTDFNGVWNKISQCLHNNGIFCGSFLGPEDTMAQPSYDRSDFWSKLSVFEENEVKELFTNYEICRFTEHKTSGTSPQGTPHDWHIYAVVAKKSSVDLE